MSVTSSLTPCVRGEGFVGERNNMADLDALLDDAAAELPTVIDVDQMLKDSKKMENVKPWLAFSSNVPPAIRDKWSQMVKVDALSKTDVRFLSD